MELLSRLKTFVLECKRVLAITRKPSRAELQTIVKVSGIGILLIGFIGFVVQMIKQMTG